MFFTFFKLYKWYQIAQRITYLLLKVVRYLPKSETAVHKCLQLFLEKRLFMSIFFTKVAGLQPVSLPKNINISEHFFAKQVWVVAASAKYYSFSLLRRPYQQNIALKLGYGLIIFKHFQSKHYESLVSSCFWKFYTIS